MPRRATGCARCSPPPAPRVTAANARPAIDWFKGEELADDATGANGLGRGCRRAKPPPAATRPHGGGCRISSRWRGTTGLSCLCFDQTESLSGDPALAAKFGEVVECLVSHGLNNMTVVTANLDPWRATILPRMQTALHARFSTPLDLRGINASQAGALARRRLEDAGLAAAEIARFCKPAWFSDVFRDKPEESVRRFLDGCARSAARSCVNGRRCRPRGWRNGSRVTSAEVEAKSQALVFDLEVLPWAVGPDVAGTALEGVTVERVTEPSGAYRVSWRSPGRRLLFGFEDSSNWVRWKSIIEQADDLARRHAREGTALRCVFLRTPEQPTLPKESWKVTGEEMKKAEAGGGFAVRVIEKDRLALLHAASSLYHDAVGGDTPFLPEETLAFLRVKLVGWWRGWLSPSE